MYNHPVHELANKAVKKHSLDIAGTDNGFYTRLLANADAVHDLYQQLYGHNAQKENVFDDLVATLINNYANRPALYKQQDSRKLAEGAWFLSNKIAGMSLYADRFCGGLAQLPGKLDYLHELGVNFIHLMPVFKSPEGESDGGYAVSDFRKVDARFGTLDDLKKLQADMQQRGMYLMIDIVLNHTSQHHEWAKKARAGEKEYQDYYYLFPDRQLPDQFEGTMPDVFPDSAPGSFTYVPELQKWVMTVFHNYQWDLNFSNPKVLVAMLDTIFFYANLGVDVLRIDAPAFIWKKLGTTSQNLPEAHTLLRLIKQCVQITAPGMALLGEAIVAPAEIMKYFGTGIYTARECDFAYNATHMALQWDAIATGDTRVMLAAQHEILKKPRGTTWITYTRCHDDIGLGYDDYMIKIAGFNPYEHRKFLQNYFGGAYYGSPAKGALFGVNPKTQDARISGTLASLCGLEVALEMKTSQAIDTAIQKILLMQAHSFFIGGLPMLFYGDELAYCNDYSYLKDSGKSYDNRWMHRPLIDWKKNERRKDPNSIEGKVFDGTKRLLAIRKSIAVIADKSNLTWFTPHNIHIAGYLRAWDSAQFYALFNFSNKDARLTWYAFREKGLTAKKLKNHWTGKEITVGKDWDQLMMKPYEFMLFEPVE